MSFFHFLLIPWLNDRSSHRRYSLKKGVLENFEFAKNCKFDRKAPVLESLLIKLQTFRPLKINCSKGIFLRNQRKFYEHLIWRTSVKNCFYNNYWNKASQEADVEVARLHFFHKVALKNNYVTTILLSYFASRKPENLSKIRLNCSVLPI